MEVKLKLRDIKVHKGLNRNDMVFQDMELQIMGTAEVAGQTFPIKLPMKKMSTAATQAVMDELQLFELGDAVKLTLKRVKKLSAKEISEKMDSPSAIPEYFRTIFIEPAIEIEEEAREEDEYADEELQLSEEPEPTAKSPFLSD